MPHHGQNSTGRSATPGAGEEALAIVRFAPPPTKKNKERQFIETENIDGLYYYHYVLLKPENTTVKRILVIVYSHGSH